MINIRTENISPEVLGTDKNLGTIFNDEQWLFYRKKWDENPKKNIIEKVPLQIDLFAVDVCNLKCPFCLRRNYSPGKGFMKFSQVKKILDDASQFGLYAFNFAGLGEPTLHPDLFKIIQYAKEKKVVDVNIHTNCTRLSPEFNQKLIESGLDRIILSIDSADKEVYEKMRVGADFEKIYAAVDDLIQQRNNSPKKRPHIKVNFINTNENDPTELNRFIHYWQDKANRIAILRYLDCKEGDEKLYHKENYVQDKNFCCPELWRRLTILSDGTATLCTRDMTKKFVVGNALTQSISSIWNGERINHVRQLHQHVEFKKLMLCNECPDSYILKGNYEFKEELAN
jgi:radical SAM protein with 4Fe4S-binding SPASM domain